MTGKYYQIKHKERYVYDISTNKGLGKKPTNTTIISSTN